MMKGWRIDGWIRDRVHDTDKAHATTPVPINQSLVNMGIWFITVPSLCYG